MSDDPAPMPSCIGLYERRNPECDGNPHGATREEQTPCHFRNKCVSMAIHCARNNVPRDSLVKLEMHGKYEVAVAKNDAVALDVLLVDGIKKYRIRDGLAAGAPAQTSGRSIRAGAPAGEPARAKPKPFRNPKPGVRDPGGWACVEDIANHFLSNLRRKLGRDIVASRPLASVGQMFIVDRRQKSGYASVYVMSPKNRPVALAIIYFKPILRNLEIRVAAPHSQFVTHVSALNQARLKAEDGAGRDGKFKTWFRQVDKAGSSIIADAILACVLSGIIQLPAADGGA